MRRRQGKPVFLKFIMDKVHCFRQRVRKLLEIFLIQKYLMFLELVFTDFFALGDRNVKVLF